MQRLILKENFVVIYYTAKQEKNSLQSTIQIYINVIKVVA